MICIICGNDKAVVPDREQGPGRPIKKVCRSCHGKRLLGDLKRVLQEHKKRVRSNNA